MYDDLEECIMILIKNKIVEQYSKNSEIKEMRQEIIKLERKGNVVIDV
ncbi:hypothetical protein [Clostridioides difficile]|nr:hypothetical protein [Clostridioides difficile]EQJ88628.1 hypothetical protein QUC_3322 [Clostridioides difficile P50]MCO8835435.1 hypothetical protein [Clostridioides difficile]